jgi:hypothetical protein
MRHHALRPHFLPRALRALLVGCLGLWGAAQAQQLAAAPPACAAAFKGQRVNLVVPHKPGGGFDAYARLLAPALEQALGARVGVTNMPAANGLAGWQALLRPTSPGVHLVGVTSLTPLWEREHILRAPDITGRDFALLGVFSHGNSVWVTRRGENPLHKPGPVLIAGSARPISAMHLPALALGLQVKPIHSLTASGESILALMRGDIDVLVMTEQLFERGAVDAAKLQPWVLLAPPLNAALQGGPVLAGPGGRVDQLTAGLSAEERRRRQAAAALAAAFGSTVYVALISRSTPAATQGCLRAVIEGIAFDPDFIAQAERQRLDPRPMRVDDTQALGRQLQQLAQAHRDVIDEAIARDR